MSSSHLTAVILNAVLVLFWDLKVSGYEIDRIIFVIDRGLVYRIMHVLSVCLIGVCLFCFGVQVHNVMICSFCFICYQFVLCSVCHCLWHHFSYYRHYTILVNSSSIYISICCASASYNCSYSNSPDHQLSSYYYYFWIYRLIYSKNLPALGSHNWYHTNLVIICHRYHR